ncbi:MAG: leucine-rich repeat protein [Clostridia bacterium]|nr:leucine-rich repeat protein [Clostridia bacterium]
MAELEEEEYSELDIESEEYSEPTKIGPNEYRSRDYSYTVLEDGTIHIDFYYGHERDLVIPTILDGFTVSQVEFAGTIQKRGVVTITIPEGVNCEMHPCYNWPNLTAIYVPKDHATLASVNGMLYTRDLRTLIAVPNAYPEKELAVPEGTLYLGNSVCWGSTLRKAILPDKLKEIGTLAFTASDCLREVNIPDSVRILERGCLSECAIESLLIPSKTPVTKEICEGDNKLREIIVMPGNETVQSIDGVMFSADGETLMAYPANKDTEEYDIPYGTVTIAGSAFRGTVNLRTVVFPESVTRLEDRAFNQSSIQTVYLPDSLESIGEAVFTGCRNLKEISASDSQPYFDAIENKYLYSKDHTVFYSYPAGLDEHVYVMEPTTRMIKERAFEHTKLAGIVLPEGLTQIGAQAFISSKLKSIYIPGTVEVIGRQAFGFCRNLERVAIEYGVKTLERWMFGDDIMLREITIPETVKEIGDLSFLNVEQIRVYTTEGSYAQQYALQNQLECETAPGNYETVTRQIKEETELMLTNAKSIEGGRVKITNKSTVNIREKPDASSRRVGRAEPGEVYRWLETVEKGGSQWYKIGMADGTEGYVSAKMTEIMQSME